MRTRLMLIVVLALCGAGCDQSPSTSKAITGSAAAGRSAASAINLRDVEMAVRQFEIDLGRLPTDQEGLAVLADASKIDASQRDGSRWAGPYLDAAHLVDRYGQPIVFRRTEDGFVLISYGEDGQPGGTGRAADYEHRVRL